MACIQCAKEHGITEEDISYIDIKDENYYETTCRRGHTRFTILTQPKFEILFEMGAVALIDGYTREAVSSMAAALERFYEYWLHVIMLKAGIPQDRFQEAWKIVSRQSERQFGAFVFSYFREFQRPPDILPQNWVEFRPYRFGRCPATSYSICLSDPSRNK
jgi:hypothetical protein